jgi:asparagine synthase (glutamine-hydrolysing)
MIEIELKHNYGFKWFEDKGVYVKGYLFDENNQIFQNQNLISYFDTVKTIEEFEEKLKNANGLFSVIIKRDHFLYMAMDRLRTFPLFYYDNKTEFIITDDTYFLKSKYELKMDGLSKEEFLSAGYVTGTQTLLSGVYQMQAAEYVQIDNKHNVEKTFYYDYRTKQVMDLNFEKLEQDFLEILNNITKRLIESAKGRTLVVPLSGGYDSRVIVALLKKHNYKNVICFTYGNKNSFEVSISQKVAETLEYPWHFVEYTEELISGFSKTKDFDQYYKFASNNTSSVHLQDYFAVRYLEKHGLIPKDSIFASGNSGDFLAGSQLPKSVKYDYIEEKIINEIYQKTYLFQELKNQDYFKNKIKLELEQAYGYSIVEDAFIKRKISKFIVNSHRTYEFFGYEHRLVLWDNEITDFFKKLSLEYKKEVYFYETILRKDIFEPLHIDFVPRDKVGRNNLTAKIKSYIKLIVPNVIIRLREKIIYQDINNLNAIAKELISELKIGSTITNINFLAAKWIIKKNNSGNRK